MNIGKFAVFSLVGALAFGSPAAEFRLASYNIRCDDGREKTPGRTWSDRLPKIRKLADAHAFDLVGLQELVREFQLDGLGKAFHEFGIIGSGRLKGRTGEGTFIMYRKAMFDLLEEGSFMLGEDPSAWGEKSYGAGYPRVCNWGLFRLKATGRKFYFFNTHLDLCGGARVKEMEQIVATMKKMVPAGTPAFLTGDMNASGLSRPIKIAEAQFDNAFKVTMTPRKGPGRSYNGWEAEPKRSKGALIDYIFLSKLPEVVQVKDLAVLDDCYEGMFPSDHFPLVATIELK